MRKIAFVYVLCLHVVIVLMLKYTDLISQVFSVSESQSNELTRHYETMTAFHSRVDNNLPEGSVIFIGDSHVQGLAVAAVTDKAVNYGIGNDTTVGVLRRVKEYHSLSKSSAVVLEIGFNDLRFRSNTEILTHYNQILTQLPDSIGVVLCAVHPVGQSKHDLFNHRIHELNGELRDLSQQFDHVTFLDVFEDKLAPGGFMPADYQLADAIHLSKKGNEIWISALRKSLENIR